MYTLLIIIHVVVSLALILIVLLQTGKGAEMGDGFGGGSNQTIFGSRGAATFLSKITTGAAVEGAAARGAVSRMTEPVRFFVMMASESEVSMNITAAPVVTLERKVAAPRLPKIV